jgi:DMSO/TMAO reductase YedYZ molybdopterin-dependent catalytic subunit
VDIAAYRLVVDGLVEKPLSLTYEQLLAYPSVSRLLILECPYVFVDYAEWTGPLLRTILEQAGVRPEAREVVLFDGDPFPYEKRVSLDEALGENMVLAYRVNGQTLPVEHGYPLRLAAGGKLGDVWVKWLFRVEVQ